MTFEKFWEENYEKDFGKCEPYYGIASYAFEVGKSFSHGDELETVEKTAERKSISEIISELENIKNEYGDFPLNYAPSVFKEYKELEMQIQKMKCCTTCKYYSMRYLPYWCEKRNEPMSCWKKCDDWELKEDENAG